MDLTSLSATDGLIIQGDSAVDKAGSSASSAGDVNGDGYDDLIVGAPRGDNGGIDAGEAYVILGGAFGRGNTPVTTTGTAAAEMLIGGLGDDVLTGGGGADVIRGGRGDDVMGVSDTGFADIDGGNGFGTLRADGSGLSFDFSTILPAEVTSIEAIDLTGTGNNSLSLSALELFDLSGDTFGGITHLTVYGNTGDSVSTFDSGWANMGTTTINSENFTIFQKGQAQAIVDSDIE